MNMPRTLRMLTLMLKPSVSFTSTRSMVSGGLILGVKCVEKML